MAARIPVEELLTYARTLIKAKPTFKVLGRTEFAPPLGKQKIFKVKCLDCGATELRPLAWIQGKHGCMCTRGSKISHSLSLGNEGFTEAFDLKKRKLKLVGPDMTTMHQRVDVKCLRCGHKWSPWAVNLRVAGCPECAQELMAKRHLKKYGVAHPNQREDVKAQKRKTMLANHGVEHALQNKSLLNKMIDSSFVRKEYQLGKRVVLVQGYEPKALDYILSKNVKPSQIRCGRDPEIPTIRYESKGKSAVYHPDIFIPHLNLIVEVKSQYTKSIGANKIALTRKACKQAGYKYRLLVMSKNGDLIHEH